MNEVAGVTAAGSLRGVIRCILCAVFVGIAVKIMDDWLDEGLVADDDRVTGRGLAAQLGAASLPYAMLSFACGVLFAPWTAAALMLNSYALGMVWSAGRDEYPSGLAGWQESALAWGLAVIGCGWKRVLVCGLCVAAVQGFDDAMDNRIRGVEAAPLVRRFGLVETVLGSCVLLLVALALDASRSAGILLGAVVVWLLESLADRSAPGASGT